jgi:hypothetical protein
MSISGRGGSREGSGRPSAWNHKKTVAIRVPECFAEQLLVYARQLDTSEIPQGNDNVQNQGNIVQYQTNNVQYQKVLLMLKDALEYPTNRFGKGKAILKEVISILESVQNQ